MSDDIEITIENNMPAIDSTFESSVPPVEAEFENNTPSVEANFESDTPDIEADFAIWVNEAQWGNIKGDVNDQTDLKQILDGLQESKVDKTDESSKVYGTDVNGDQTLYDLDSFGQVDDVQIDGVSVVTNKIAELGTMAAESITDYYTKSEANNTFADISYEDIINNHIADKDNPHEVTKDQVGLGNVDNTSDLDKPISTATQEALDSKQATISDLSTIRENAQHGESAYNTISGYGNIVTHNVDEFATAAQGTLADTAVQPNDLATVATSGSYNDLLNKPTIGNATLTIQKNGTNIDSFTANATVNKIINVTVPTTASDIGALPDTTTINDLTTTAQQNALNSGATSTNIGQIATNTLSINAINDKIPAQASSSNQLADKNFVNSSIATNRANFIGTFANVAALESYVGTVTNNDYAFVVNSVVEDNGGDWASFSDLDNYDKSLLTNVDYAWVVNGSNFDLYRFDIVLQTWELRASNIEKSSVTLNRAFNEYKATDNGGIISWEYEYTLNNSSFTATQWAAINSGITSGDVALIQTAIQPSDLATVATSGSYNDLSNKPTIGNATLTIQKNGTTVNTFTANATSNKTINLTVPTATSDLTNDSGFLTNTASEDGSLTILGEPSTTTSSINIGDGSSVDDFGIALGIYNFAGDCAISIGNGTLAYGMDSIAIGYSSIAIGEGAIAIGDGASTHAGTSYAIQLGSGENEESNSFYVGTGTDNWKMLGGDGLIPDDRISSNIARSSAIPTVNDATITIQKNWNTVSTFTLNQSSNETINLTVPTATSDLTNDSGFLTSAQLDVKQDKLTSANAGTNISITAKILPDEYQLLEYLGANDTINLGFPTTNNSKIECSWIKNANNTEYVYSSDSGSSLTTNTTAYSAAAGNWRFGNRTASINTSALTDYLTVQDNTGVSVNGVLTAYSTVNTFTSSTNLKLFQSSSQKETILIKYLKHYTRGVLDFHILPCKRIADDTYGFYDVVGGNFYTKESASWEVGQAVTDKTIISFVNNSGYITGITSGDVTTALGYTPVNSSSLATVATSGSYNDLSNKPTIPSAQVNADWNASSGVAQILNKPTLATVATSGSYNDLSNKPTIGNATLTIQKNGTTVNTFTANASSNVTANITVPTNTNELTNGAGFITGISSSDVTTALGYTPAKTDLSNLGTTSTKNLDGQWVSSQHDMISSNTTLTSGQSYEYSLATYLPNDSYDYEVLFTVNGQTGTTSGNAIELGVGSSYVDESIYRVTANTTRASNSVIAAGNGVMLIGSDRKIKLRQIQSPNCLVVRFRCFAYRRIGTNS